MMNKFPFSEEGRAFLQMYIKPLNKTALVRVLFKVDPGADLTTISKSDLIRLGYTYEWIDANIVTDISRTISRAGGTAQPAYYVRVGVINLLGRDLVNWPLYIRKERDRDFPNLLGVNVLSHFKFLFDYESWNFEIEGISKPKRSLPMLKEQSVYELNGG